MKSQFLRTILVPLGILLICLWALPQIRESGEIQGHVTDDQDNPLPGVELTLESPDLIGPYMRTLIAMHRDTMGVAIR